ncbi:hypothetical protein A0257_01990 [Hymenobacter psoromatis]|nr:hypothetical protein A0257_01990 [Hymenobacter psoromatis]
MENSPKIALITGANRGLGLEIARQLGQRHYTVLLGARHEAAGRAAAALLVSEGLRAHYLPLDITLPDSVAQAAATVERDYGRLDVLVNNAVYFARENQNPSQISPDLLHHYL